MFLLRAQPAVPVWVYHYHSKHPMPGWLKWNPWVAWVEDRNGGITDISIPLPNGLYLQAKEGDYIVRGPIGEITLLTPNMYQKYYQPAEDTQSREPPVPTIPVYGPVSWQAAAAEGVSSA